MIEQVHHLMQYNARQDCTTTSKTPRHLRMDFYTVQGNNSATISDGYVLVTLLRATRFHCEMSAKKVDEVGTSR